jgi:hypothetical protein
MKCSKGFILIFLFIISANFGFSHTDLYLFGKENFIGKTGSEKDYKEGENDFPVASSFNTLGLGLGLTTRIDPVFLGIEAHFNLGGKTILTDTSDNDTVKINTYEYASGFLLFGVNLLQSHKLCLFINTGAGISFALNAKMQRYFSEYGYETEIDPPERKYPFTVFGGIGLKIYFNPALGMIMNTRYQYMDQDQPQSAFCVTAGMVYTF